MTDIYSNDLFDIDSVGMFFEAGFNRQRENLDRPSDEELTSILGIISNLEPTSELKNTFWNSWLVEESSLCIASLCFFLEDPFISTQNKQIKPDILNRETKQIEYILTLEMTSNVKKKIERLLKWEQEALAEWNKEETTS